MNECMNGCAYPVALLLGRPVLVLDILPELGVGPVEQNLGALAGDQQTLHLDRRGEDGPLCFFYFYRYCYYSPTGSSLQSLVDLLTLLERNIKQQHRWIDMATVEHIYM